MSALPARTLMRCQVTAPDATARSETGRLFSPQKIGTITGMPKDIAIGVKINAAESSGT